MSPLFVPALLFLPLAMCRHNLLCDFQTLYVEPGLCLCDCPGLVMPSFVSTKAEMICNGILPIDQMRDHVPPVSLVCQNIPRRVLEVTYGINIIKPREDEDPYRPPTSEELLTAYGCELSLVTQAKWFIEIWRGSLSIKPRTSLRSTPSCVI